MRDMIMKSHEEDCECITCTQPRYKSVAAWAAMFALAGLLLSTAGIYDILGITGTQYEAITDMVLSCLVGFGILNNPTSKTTF